MKSEADLARLVVEWLRNMRWTVYQEVRIAYGDRRADIVAAQENILWVIEAKKSLSLDLLDQAYDWIYYSHYVSIAVPRRHRGLVPGVACHVLREFGIGMFQVRDKHQTFVDAVEETIHPSLHRKAKTERLWSVMNEAQQTYSEAGNAQSKFWTPFKATCEEVRRYVGQHPGCSLKDCIESVHTHYHSTSTAKSCMSKWLRKGIVEGVEMRTEGRSIRLHPVDLTKPPDGV